MYIRYIFSYPLLFIIHFTLTYKVIFQSKLIKLPLMGRSWDFLFPTDCSSLSPFSPSQNHGRRKMSSQVSLFPQRKSWLRVGHTLRELPSHWPALETSSDFSWLRYLEPSTYHWVVAYFMIVLPRASNLLQMSRICVWVRDSSMPHIGTSLSRV